MTNRARTHIHRRMHTLFLAEEGPRVTRTLGGRVVGVKYVRTDAALHWNSWIGDIACHGLLSLNHGT